MSSLRLLGCQNLLTEVPGRTPRSELTSPLAGTNLISELGVSSKNRTTKSMQRQYRYLLGVLLACRLWKFFAYCPFLRKYLPPCFLSFNFSLALSPQFFLEKLYPASSLQHYAHNRLIHRTRSVMRSFFPFVLCFLIFFALYFFVT